MGPRSGQWTELTQPGSERSPGPSVIHRTPVAGDPCPILSGFYAPPSVTRADAFWVATATSVRIHSHRPFIFAGAAIALFAAWIGAGLGGSTCAKYVDDLATPAAALVATALCARAALRQVGRLRLVWFFLALACAAWSLGELSWGFYDLIDGSVPDPSWADVAYLAALPPAAAALLAHPALHSRALGQARSLLDGLVLAIAIFLLSWVLVLEPLTRTSDLSTLGGAVTTAYPLGDIVIVFLVVLVIRGITGGNRLDLWCVLGGLLAITLSDSIFGYLVQASNYSTGNVIDTGWFAGYLGIALGAHYARTESHPQRSETSPALTSAAVIGPFIPLLAALCLAAIEVELGHRLDGVSLALAFVLVGLVLSRQVVLVVDLIRPGLRHDAPVATRVLAALGEAHSEGGQS